MNHTLKTIPNITSLRFLLATLVVIFHISEFFQKRGLPYFNDLPVFHKGADAVYVFFSLSGFLIINLLYNEKLKTNTIKLKAFFIRRMCRIYPVYYVVLIFGFLYYQIVLPKLGYPVDNNYDLLKGIFLGVTFFPNILSTYLPGGILEILWSIGVEEQFYLLIAPLLFFTAIKKIRFILLFFTIAFFLVYFFSPLDFFSKYGMLFFYFSFSGLCSINIKNKHFNNFITKCRTLILAVFCLHLVTNFFVFEQDYNNHLFTVILFGLSVSALSVAPIALLENKYLVYLGKISYGIYMYHAIVMQFVGLFFIKILSKFEIHDVLEIILSNLLVLCLTILASHISYQYYELYFLSKKVR